MTVFHQWPWLENTFVIVFMGSAIMIMGVTTILALWFSLFLGKMLWENWK
jgi:hypothetical protein